VTNAGNLRPLGGAVAVVAGATPTGPLLSALIRSRTSRHQGIFGMQPTEDCCSSNAILF
jgi:hypothetical protein